MWHPTSMAWSSLFCDSSEENTAELKEGFLAIWLLKEGCLTSSLKLPDIPEPNRRPIDGKLPNSCSPSSDRAGSGLQQGHTNEPAHAGLSL